MLVWTLAISLIVCSGVVGWYVGAVRSGITTIGMILALLFLAPCAAMVAKLLPSVGAKHPATIGILAPIIVFVLFQIIAKSISQSTKPGIENFYKYKATDTQRLLFERMNQRVGPCVGVINGVLYTLFLGIFAVGVGYATVTFSRNGGQDAWWQRAISALGLGYQNTGLAKVVGPYVPAKPLYFDVIDLAGQWFHQPLVQSSLATYPPLIPMAERADMQSLSTDVASQEFLLKRPTASQFMDHPKLGPIVTSPVVLEQALGLLGNDLTDIQGYVKDQKSAKFDHEKVLGRWDFNLPGTINENKRTRRMTGIEVNKMRGVLSAQLEGITLLALIDGKVIVRRPAADGTMGRREGSWKKEEGGKYQLTLPVTDDRNLDLAVSIEGKKLSTSLANYAVVFDRW
jgi:hypothetical protein